MPVIRAFIAIEISPVVRQKLEEVSKELQQKMSGLPVRWVPVNNIHLTLVFLGEVSTTNIPSVVSELHSGAGQHPPFEIEVGKLGAFPSFNNPRVVWIGVTAPSVFSELQSGLAMRMNRLGYSGDERDFTPHLTLGRVARTASKPDAHRIGELLQQVKVGYLGKVEVREVSLFKSDLQREGAVYERLSTAPLGVFTPGG